jgi:hypothetical protein
MKIVMASNGKKTVKMSKSEWTEIGKKSGWTKISQNQDMFIDDIEEAIFRVQKVLEGCKDIGATQLLNKVAEGERALKDLLNEMPARSIQKQPEATRSNQN